MRPSMPLICLGLAFSTGFALAETTLPLPPPVTISTPYLQPIAHWAIPANTSHYVGYYVGGGCPRPRRADGRAADEGTWGWDYCGCLIPRDIMHGWWHSRRYQDGNGAYGTDGPH